MAYQLVACLPSEEDLTRVAVSAGFDKNKIWTKRDASGSIVLLEA
jgi:hypothetical protein